MTAITISSGGLPAAAVPELGVIVRAVIPAPYGIWWAHYSDGEEHWITEVIAWADCMNDAGQWLGLLPVVPADRATGTIADPKDGFTGITRERMGVIR